jgi:hypothetical protein
VAVGQFSDYGAAQRLYLHLGYVPYGEDTNGDGLSGSVSVRASVDDDLVLWLVKSLDDTAKQ